MACPQIFRPRRACLIAGLAMSVRIVERLEFVDIEQHGRKRRAGTPALGILVIHIFIQGAAIGQAGQCIGPGLGNLCFELPRLAFQFLWRSAAGSRGVP